MPDSPRIGLNCEPLLPPVYEVCQVFARSLAVPASRTSRRAGASVPGGTDIVMRVFERRRTDGGAAISSTSRLVFQAPTGGPVRATNFRNRVYDPALRAAGLEGLSFHRLRHSAGHMLGKTGVPLEIIQRRLGHSSIRTTADIYGSLPEKVDREVAEKLDDLYAAGRTADPHHETGGAG